MAEIRYDFVPLSAVEVDPRGFLRFNANLTRTGVLEYRRSDGSIQRELRHPDEVFKKTSLDSLSNAPVTDLHSEMVSPNNAKNLSVGIVSEQVTHDKSFVKGTVLVWDASMIEKIDRGERKELSPGYGCDVVVESGEYNGETYDALQKNIIYNHVGIGPDGWGRSGSKVALRLDGDAAASSIHIPEKKAADKPEKEIKTMTIKVHIDDVEYEVGTDSWKQATEKQQSRVDAELKELRDKLSKAEGRADAAESKVQQLEKELKEATDPTRMEAIITERADLVAKAREVLGKDEDLAGKTPREIKEAVLMKIDSKLDLKDKDDGYVDGSYEFALKNYKKDSGGGNHRDGLSSLRRVIPMHKPDPENKDDERYDFRKAQAEMVHNNANAWKPKSA